MDFVRFVSGAIGGPNLLPIMEHYHFYPNRVQATNGHLVLDAPTGLDINATAKALRVNLALKSTEEPIITATDHTLIVKEGSYRASIKLTPEEYPVHAVPKRLKWSKAAGLCEALKVVLPFASTHGAQPWTTTVRLTESHIYATTGYVLIRYQHKSPFSCVLPRALCEELVRLGDPVDAAMYKDGRHVVYRYDTGAWLQGAMSALDWSVDPEQLLNGARTKVPDGLWEAVELVAPLCTDEPATVTLRDNLVSTNTEEHSASVDGFTFKHPVKFRLDTLRAVLSVAEKINFATFPRCCFTGPGVSGTLMGIST